MGQPTGGPCPTVASVWEQSQETLGAESDCGKVKNDSNKTNPQPVDRRDHDEHVSVFSGRTARFTARGSGLSFC